MSLEDKIDKTKTRNNKLEDYLAIAKEYSDVKSIFNSANPKELSSLEKRLVYHVEEVSKENRKLRYFAKTADTVDRVLVPIDALADAAGILTGIGYGISVSKELLEAPFKIANTLYYTAKTKEYLTPMKDLGYELLSFVIPGSLLDLTNRYIKRADKYTIKEAVRRFVKEVKDKKEKPTLVDIAEEFRQAA